MKSDESNEKQRGEGEGEREKNATQKRKQFLDPRIRIKKRSKLSEIVEERRESQDKRNETRETKNVNPEESEKKNRKVPQTRKELRRLSPRGSSESKARPCNQVCPGQRQTLLFIVKHGGLEEASSLTWNK